MPKIKKLPSIPSDLSKYNFPPIPGTTHSKMLLWLDDGAAIPDLYKNYENIKQLGFMHSASALLEPQKFDMTFALKGYSDAPPECYYYFVYLLEHLFEEIGIKEWVEVETRPSNYETHLDFYEFRGGKNSRYFVPYNSTIHADKIVISNPADFVPMLYYTNLLYA